MASESNFRPSHDRIIATRGWRGAYWLATLARRRQRARDRPTILLELLSGTHEDPAADTAAICESFGYDAFIVQRGEKIAALPAIAALGKNTSWGTGIESRPRGIQRDEFALRQA